MEDHRFIPEFSPSRPAVAVPSRVPSERPQASASSSTVIPAARRFRKGDAVAEIRERNMREFQLIEWALVLNGRVVTTRQFDAGERSDFEHEVRRVTSDLAGSGWIEDLASIA